MKVAAIPAVDLPAVRMRLGLIQQKRLELVALETELRVFLESTCRVDLTHEVWELDEQHGLLIQRADADGNPAPDDKYELTQEG